MPLYAPVCPFKPLYSPLLQEYADIDGQGDACDDDMDNDGVMNVKDNCPGKANRLQEDRDGDSVGDICDNCPGVSNRDQTDINYNNQDRIK